MMKKIVVGTVLLSALALSSPAEAKVAVVSFEEVLAKTRVGKRISGEIARYFKRKQVHITRKKAGLQSEEKQIFKAFKQLEASKTILRGSVYKARKAKLEQRYRKLLMSGQRLIQRVSSENSKLQKKRYEKLKPLRSTFISTVQALAKARGYAIVIERSAVYYYQGSTDITAQVVKRIDASTK